MILIDSNVPMSLVGAPVDREIVERAKAIVLGRAKLSARDALHVAIMQAYEIPQILSFDSGFDSVPGIKRITG
jgi:predicted nucleic acid-binding protein